MVLGRTPEGLIKIKTDEEGGGLRAVNCACCGGCEACGFRIPETLRNVFENATSATLWGFTTNFFISDENSWYGEWFYLETEDSPGMVGNVQYFKDTGCFESSPGNSYFPFAGSPTFGQAAYGEKEGCIITGFTGEAGTFTINGIGEFPYFYYTGEGFAPPPVPNLVVS